MSSPLEVFSDLSEKIHYNLSDLPLYVKKDELSRYGYIASCHWHVDLEFIFIIDGEMDFFINGKVITIRSNDGVFINSKRLHYGFSKDKKNCNFIVLVVNTTLFSDCSHVFRGFFDKKFGMYASDFIILSNQITWQRNILSLVVDIYNEANESIFNPFRLLSDALSVCANISDYIEDDCENRVDNHIHMIVWKMTGYIHRNYDRKITLDDIASSGAVCRSRCCELFKEHINQTPNSYLIRYRLSRSYEMLRETKRTISEIAMSCGFQSCSYFSYIFRKEIGMKPNEYRKRNISSDFDDE